MAKKVHIIIDLLPEASEASPVQIEEKIRNEAKIPLCQSIKEVVIEDTKESYMKLTKQGVSSNVARNLLDLYTE